MDDFYELAKLCHQDRVNAEQDKLKNLDNQASVLYNTFCIWCRINGKKALEKYFKEYLSTKDKEVDFWLKKKVFEKYFGYTFEYDYDKKKWISKKNKAV